MPVLAARPTRRRWRTSLAGVTALAVGSALLVAAQQASAAPTKPDPQKALGYLTAQLVDGHYYDPFDVQQADWGLTIDGALALAAHGARDAAYVKLVDFLAGNGKDAAGTDVISWTGIGTDYPDGGSIAKLALLAETAGRDPHQFAGHDLVAELAKTVCPGIAPIGQSTCAGAGNYAGGSSVFKQALGIIGQVRGGASADAPTTFLLSRQSADGGWPSLIPSGGAASDVDSTAMAVMALTLVPGDDAAAAARRGIAWIAGTQLSDGAFPGYARQRSEPAHSTNSTALALQALRLSAADRSTQIGKALAFMAARQNADGGFDIDSANDSSDVRATTQAVVGVVGRSYATLLRDHAAAAHAVTGAAYLVGRLTGGSHLESSFDDGQGTVQTFVDYGLTADVALALASTGSQDPALAKVVGYLRAHVGDYVDQTGAAGGPYGGAAGKLAVLAEVTGQHPAAFGGVNLLTVLTGNVCTTGNPDPNAFDACTAPGDFRGAYSGVSQALGVLALGRSGVPVPAPALTRLVQLQCADGGFSSVLIAPGAVCTSDVDTTGYAVQALSLQPTRQSEVARGWQYLRTAQAPGGGWAGAAGVNSNSTGLATQAVLALLDRGGYVSAASRTLPAGWTPPAASVNGVQAAFRFLEARQRADGGFDVSATEAGDEGTRTRATTQAVPALAGALLTTLLDPVTPVDPPAPSTSTTTTAPSATSTSTPTSSSSTSTWRPSDTSSPSGPSSPSDTTTSTPSGTSAASVAATPGGGSTPAGTVSSSGDLAHTGSSIGVLVAVAVLLLLAGLVLLVGRRLTVRGERR